MSWMRVLLMLCLEALKVPEARVAAPWSSRYSEHHEHGSAYVASFTCSPLVSNARKLVIYRHKALYVST